MKYVVINESEGQTWWLSDIEGDPGRTVVLENAKVFNSFKLAQEAVEYAINRYN